MFLMPRHSRSIFSLPSSLSSFSPASPWRPLTRRRSSCREPRTRRKGKLRRNRSRRASQSRGPRGRLRSRRRWLPWGVVSCSAGGEGRLVADPVEGLGEALRAGFDGEGAVDDGGAKDGLAVPPEDAVLQSPHLLEGEDGLADDEAVAVDVAVVGVRGLVLLLLLLLIWT